MTYNQYHDPIERAVEVARMERQISDLTRERDEAKLAHSSCCDALRETITENSANYDRAETAERERLVALAALEDARAAIATLTGQRDRAVLDLAASRDANDAKRIALQYIKATFDKLPFEYGCSSLPESCDVIVQETTKLRNERDEARNQLSIERELSKQRWLDLAAAESKLDQFRRQLREWANYGVSSADIRAFLEES